MTIEKYKGKYIVHYTGENGKNYSASLHQGDGGDHVVWVGADHMSYYGDGNQEAVNEAGKTLLDLSKLATTLIESEIDSTAVE